MELIGNAGGRVAETVGTRLAVEGLTRRFQDRAVVSGLSFTAFTAATEEKAEDIN
jgi:hypothetical protein